MARRLEKGAGMRNKLSVLWNRVAYSMWVVPTLMVIAFVALAVGSVELTFSMGAGSTLPWGAFFLGDADSARLILSTVATSMMTITGVAFSITIVALALASSQYTSRVLGNFMRDRATQMALGTLSGVFAFCLTALLRIGKGGGQEPAVPAPTIFLALAFGILGVGAFIFFIHHIAARIRATSIVTEVRIETIAVIAAMWPDRGAEERSCGLDLAGPGWHGVASVKTGYLQNVETQQLARWASKHGLVIKIEKAVGDFVIKGEALAAYKGGGPGNACEDIADFCIIDEQRTIEKDPLFGVRQIVDIALKALSPGVNDVTTAVICIHQLTAILCEAIERREEPEICYFREEPRVSVRSLSFPRLLREATEEIRQSARGNPRIRGELVKMMATLRERAPSADMEGPLLRATPGA